MWCECDGTDVVTGRLYTARTRPEIRENNYGRTSFTGGGGVFGCCGGGRFPSAHRPQNIVNISNVINTINIIISL